MAILSEPDLLSMAEEFVRRHGFDAPIFAAMRADELLAATDLDGSRNFQLIVARINRLLEDRRGEAN